MEKPALVAADKTAAPNRRHESSGLAEYTGTWDTTAVMHLLKRTLFGVAETDLQHFLTLSMSQSVDELLSPTASPITVPLNNYSSDGYSDPTGVAAWDTWINTGIDYQDPDMNTKRNGSMQCWWIGQMLNEQRSVHEKMTLFWHNHFGVDCQLHIDDIPARPWYDYYMTLRGNALGNFKSMVKSVTLSPAMLCYLNGNTNKKQSPNENYGRELQELYTIGKGAGSKYTEDDVRAAAKVLTGHSVDAEFNYIFDAAGHDDTSQAFSTFYGSTMITGRSGSAGASELDDMLTMFFNTSESAKFICRKIYRFFLYYKIDDSVESNIIGPLSSIFRSSGYDITATLSALFKSEHFYDLAYSSACLIKSPIDFVLGLHREFRVTMPDASDTAGSYAAWQMLLDRTALLQQKVLGVPEVAGWYPYYEGTAYHELWINAVTYSDRNQFTDQMITTGNMMGMVNLKIDAVAFASSLANPEDPDKLIGQSLDILYRVPLSADGLAYLKTNILLSGQTSDYYWTNAWVAYTSNPTDMVARSTVETRLVALYKYLMNLPEYHLS